MERDELLSLISDTHNQAVTFEEMDSKVYHLKKALSIRYIIIYTFGCFLSFVAFDLVIRSLMSDNPSGYDLAYLNISVILYIVSLFVPLIFFTWLKIIRTPKFKILSSELDNEYNKLMAIPGIPNDYKNSHDLKSIYKYIHNMRADNMKEAINLHVKEENDERRHQQQMDAIEDISYEVRSSVSDLSRDVSDVKNRID